MWVLCQEVSGANIHLTRLKNFARENHSSLLLILVNYGQKSFKTLATAQSGQGVQEDAQERRVQDFENLPAKHQKPQRLRWGRRGLGVRR